MKKQMEKMDGMSMDLTKKNVERIKELFPNAVTEGKIDFDVLRQMLGDDVDTSREKYQFTWNGKSDSIKLAQTPSSATLRPAKKKSKNWENTENLYIEGDNLEVLKQLQKTYFGRVKMIYIDPPYNSRQYSDAYHLVENIARWKKPEVFGVARKMDRKAIKEEAKAKKPAKKAKK